MAAIIDAIGVVLSIFLMIAVGILLTYIGWIKDTESKFLAKFVVNVALPSTIISNILGKLSKDNLVGMAAGLCVPAIALLTALAIGVYTARLLKLPNNRRGVFACMFTFSNSVFIGLPVCRALFGEDAVPFTLMYYISNTVPFWTIGYGLMQSDGGGQVKANFRMLPKYLRAENKSDPEFDGARAALTRLKKVLPLPLLTLLASSGLLLLSVKLPPFVMSSAKYIGDTVTPISLIYTGYVLANMIKKRQFRFEKGYTAIIIGKFILMPCLVIGLVKLFSLSAGLKEMLTYTMTGTFIIEASMPVMTQTTIIEANCGGDHEYAAGGTALTTALSMLFIPLYMYIINYII